MDVWVEWMAFFLVVFLVFLKGVERSIRTPPLIRGKGQFGSKTSQGLQSPLPPLIPHFLPAKMLGDVRRGRSNETDLGSSTFDPLTIGDVRGKCARSPVSVIYYSLKEELEVARTLTRS